MITFSNLTITNIELPEMPNRILRDWTASEIIDKLSVEGERFFGRLIMKVDDYGCIYANAKLLRAALFPLKLEQVHETDVSKCVNECANVGLIKLYEHSGKQYLQIVDFRQPLRQKHLKHPLPEETYNPASKREPLKKFDPKETENKITEFKSKSIGNEIWVNQTCKAYVCDEKKLLAFCNSWIEKSIAQKKFESYQVNALIAFMLNDFENKKPLKVTIKKDYSQHYKK